MDQELLRDIRDYLLIGHPMRGHMDDWVSRAQEHFFAAQAIARGNVVDSAKGALLYWCATRRERLSPEAIQVHDRDGDLREIWDSVRTTASTFLEAVDRIAEITVQRCAYIDALRIARACENRDVLKRIREMAERGELAPDSTTSVMSLYEAASIEPTEGTKWCPSE